MTLRALTVALAVSTGAALMLPAPAEAQHRRDRHDRYEQRDRHDRRGRHDRYERRDRYDHRHYDHRRYDRRQRHDHRRPSYYYRSAPRYYPSYDPYDYGYYGRPYPHRPAYHDHSGRRCSRVHVGLYLGW